MLVPQLEKWFFNKSNSQIIKRCAHNVDSYYAADRMQRHPQPIVDAHIIQNILPQPLTHCFTIGMNQEHSKCGCCNSVDNFAVSDFKIFKKQK